MSGAVCAILPCEGCKCCCLEAACSWIWSSTSGFAGCLRRKPGKGPSGFVGFLSGSCWTLSGSCQVLLGPCQALSGSCQVDGPSAGFERYRPVCPSHLDRIDRITFQLIQRTFLKKELNVIPFSETSFGRASERTFFRNVFCVAPSQGKGLGGALSGRASAESLSGAPAGSLGGAAAGEAAAGAAAAGAAAGDFGSDVACRQGRTRHVPPDPAGRQSRMRPVPFGHRDRPGHHAGRALGIVFRAPPLLRKCDKSSGRKCDRWIWFVTRLRTTGVPSVAPRRPSLDF